VDEYKVTIVSNNSPYLTGYKTTSKFVESNYIYSVKNHNYRHQKLTQPYIAELQDEKVDEDKSTIVSNNSSYLTSYKTTSKSVEPNYIYSAKNQNRHHQKLTQPYKAELQDEKVDEDKAAVVSNNSPFLTSYKTTSKFVEPNYIYSTKNHNHHHQKLTQPYNIELQDEKVDEDKATVVSTNSPYLTGYETTSKSVEPNYIYFAKNHNHHHQKLTQSYTAELQDEKVDEDKATVMSNNSPYLTSYKTTSKSVEPNYIYSAKNHNHHDQKFTQPHTAELQDEKVDEDKAAVVSNNSPYLISYKTTSKSVEPNYIYSAKNHNHHHQKLTQPYTTELQNEKVDEDKVIVVSTNSPYLTGYETTSKSVEPNYIYSAKNQNHHNQKLTQPYTTELQNEKADEDKDTVVSNDSPYLTNYKITSKFVESNYIYSATNHNHHR